MFMRSLLTGAALLSLVALPAYAAGQSSSASAKPASTVTTPVSAAKPAAATEASKITKPAAEKTVAEKVVHKHRVAMHKSRRMHKAAKVAVKSGTQVAKAESSAPKTAASSVKGGK